MQLESNKETGLKHHRNRRDDSDKDRGGLVPSPSPSPTDSEEARQLSRSVIHRLMRATFFIVARAHTKEPPIYVLLLCRDCLQRLEFLPLAQTPKSAPTPSSRLLLRFLGGSRSARSSTRAPNQQNKPNDTTTKRRKQLW